MKCMFCNHNLIKGTLRYDCNCHNNLTISVDGNDNIKFWDIFIYLNNKKMIIVSDKLLNTTKLILKDNLEKLIEINQYSELGTSDKDMYELANKLYALSLYK